MSEAAGHEIVRHFASTDQRPGSAIVAGGANGSRITDIARGGLPPKGDDMLTLTNPLTIEGFKVYRDDQNSTQFYVMPDQPAIALDDAGKPIFSLIVYRRDEDRIDPDKPKDDVGGGILTFTVELAVPPAALKKIHSQVRSIVFGDGSGDASQDVQVTTVDFFDGTVSVAVAGEGTGGSDNQFVSSAVGSGKIAGVAVNRKAVMVKLTQ